jgi:hypothetical protein
VARRLELGEAAGAVFAAAAEEAAAPLAVAADGVRGQRLAFVVEPAQIARLTDPGRFWGVPAVAFLRELGFGVDVLVYESGPPLRPPLSGFRTPEDLAQELRDGRFSAVYSEYFFDRRLVAAGKAQFSLSCFEMGLGGAVRTCRRLEGLCRWPFYRRYAAYLGGA